MTRAQVAAQARRLGFRSIERGGGLLSLLAWEREAPRGGAGLSFDGARPCGRGWCVRVGGRAFGLSSRHPTRGRA